MKSPLITMSAITGKPKKAEIHSYMRSLKRNGIEQVMLYPRSGCEVAYLSDEWFLTIGEFLEAAKKLDMNIWLYDDFNWPSGNAGGRITAVPEYRLKAITVKGENIGQISCRPNYPNSLFGEVYFPDLLSGKAVDYFIQCTHEEYYKRFQAYFGSTVKGFFTDEPSIGYCCRETSIPYYDGMEQEYQETYGRDFSEDMRSGYEHFAKNAVLLVGDRFRTSYVEKIQRWCADRGILMTGHFMEDNLPTGATRHSGNFLKNLSAFSLPGIDEIDTMLTEAAFTDGAILSLLGGAEYASGEHGAMAELFALGPCDMTYAKKKSMLFLTACFKINHYFLAVSPLDLRGNRKLTDYFNCFTEDQPDFKGCTLLAEDAKIASMYAGKDYTPDVYVRYPAGWCAEHYTDQVSIKPFSDLLNRLSAYQLQWKFAAEDDACEDAPVIEFDDSLAYRFSGLVTSDVEAVCSMLPQTIRVTNTDGTLPRGIFVRSYDDHSLVAINLYGEAGNYMVDGQKITLDTHGVYISTMPQAEDTVTRREKISSVFDIHYYNENMLRCMFIAPQTEAEIHTDGEREVRFAVRDDASAYLCGKKIDCVPGGDGLSNGLKKLYGVSSLIKLRKGVSGIRSDGDLKYLPSVFVIGDFCAKPKSDTVCGMVLEERKRTCVCGEYFRDFGKVEFSAKVHVPQGAKALELEGTTLYTSVYADDLPVDEKIYAPYLFHLSPGLQGKDITLKIVQCSSIAPIFSDVAYFEEKSEYVKWRGTPNPTETRFGFAQLHWIF